MNLDIIKNRIIDKCASISHALKKMDENAVKLLFVFEEERFYGLLSIGDIQRAIIKNFSLSSEVGSILREEITLCYELDTYEDIKSKMLKFRTECMPILNEKSELVNVIFWDDIYTNKTLPPKSYFNLPVVIMAGGLGTRLKPLTNIIPKPLIPIGDKTILEQIFDRFHKHGCSDFYLSVNYKGDLIKYYLQNLKLPYNISYFMEDKPMGTAGSISLIKERINDTFFVSNCDIIVEQDYSEILSYHKEHNNEITIVAALKNYSIPYGTITSGKNGELLELIEKPELTFLINSGMYVLEPSVLNDIPNSRFYHITDLIEKVREGGRNVGVFPVSEKSWIDIGEWPQYKQLINI